jgi:small-conductance mechanosensitive channel
MFPQLPLIPPSLIKLLGVIAVWVVASGLINSLGVKWLKLFLIHAQKAGHQSPKEKHRRADTITLVVRATVMIVLTVTLGMIGLSALGFDIGPLIAGAGIAGLAISFGSQNLVRDFITGLFILIENQFDLGDQVKIGGVSGVVEQFNLRHTVLRDADGTRHYIPNSTISVLSNQSQAEAVNPKK